MSAANVCGDIPHRPQPGPRAEGRGPRAEKRIPRIAPPSALPPWRLEDRLRGNDSSGGLVTKSLFLLHIASTWYLVGLCWIVQRVQYPLMDLVGRSGYQAYEQAHISRIGPVVAPMMLLEVATGIGLLSSGDPAFRSAAFLGSIALLVTIWASTFFVQVPLHGTLTSGFDEHAHGWLVSSNWIRTIAWTARGGLLLWLAWVTWLRDAP